MIRPILYITMKHIIYACYVEYFDVSNYYTSASFSSFARVYINGDYVIRFNWIECVLQSSRECRLIL